MCPELAGSNATRDIGNSFLREIDSMSDVIKKISKKRVRLGLRWNDAFINFCTVVFTSDNTFIFTSGFHNEKGALEIGTSRVFQGQFIGAQALETHQITNGCHISLHPREGVMHLRENPRGRVLSEKKFDWFPVGKPFQLLRLYSPPLDECPKSSKSSPFLAPIPTNYHDSILVTIDIFPRIAKQHFPNSQSVWIFWGFCPEYLVRASFILARRRTPAIICWPVDDGFLSD